MPTSFRHVPVNHAVTSFSDTLNNEHIIKAKQLYLNPSRWKYNNLPLTMSPLIARDCKTKLSVEHGEQQQNRDE